MGWCYMFGGAVANLVVHKSGAAPRGLFLAFKGCRGYWIFGAMN